MVPYKNKGLLRKRKQKIKRDSKRRGEGEEGKEKREKNEQKSDSMWVKNMYLYRNEKNINSRRLLQGYVKRNTLFSE